jgi:hypothetical protein
MSPSVNKFCLFCLIHRSEINFKSNVDQLVLRDYDYNQAVVASNERVCDISQSGIKYASLLNASRYFHFAENLNFDAMHDFLEGVCPFSIKLVLHELATIYPEYGVDADFLNQRFENFQYSFYDLSNKPSAKFTDDNIEARGNYSTKQSAGQIFFLRKIFALLVGDKIPEGNIHFAIILTLRLIMDIIFSLVVTQEHTVVFEVLIIPYFEEFRKAFPSLQGINKLHHMVHYPQIIRSQVPPVRYWCMRYEAYHNIAKILAQVNFNFKNITLSVANHLQLFKCSSLLSEDLLLFLNNRCCYGRSHAVARGSLALDWRPLSPPGLIQGFCCVWLLMSVTILAS